MAQKPKGEVAPGLKAETKTKVVIPDWAGRLLVLTRSPLESTRPGKPDLPGGSMDSGDTDGQGRFDLLKVINRETTAEEMPGTVLDNIRLLGFKAARKKDGDVTTIKTSVVLGATAEFPEEGIVLGGSPDFEHVDAEWLGREEVAGLDGLPSKYKRAIEVSGHILDELAELQADRAGEPPVPLSARAVRELGAAGLLTGQETPLAQGDQAFEAALRPAAA